MRTVYFIVTAIVIIAYIIYSIRKNRLSAGNSFIWILFSIALIFLAIFPKSLDWVAGIVGITYPPTLFLTGAIIILFMMNFQYSKKIEELQKRVVDLGQELSVVKSEKNGKK